MRRSEFNARIAHVHKVRAQQRAVRNKVASISGPPTYIRQMANESVKKARFNAMGDIVFNNSADRMAYETAAQVPIRQYGGPRETPGLIDDPVKGSLDDEWSMVGDDKTPQYESLYNEAKLAVSERGVSSGDYDDAVHAEYKRMVRVRHGISARPFKDSTMMVSHLNDDMDPTRMAGVRQLAEIQDAIDKLNQTLVVINQQIKDSEADYYNAESEVKAARANKTYASKLNRADSSVVSAAEVASFDAAVATKEAEMQVINALLNGDALSQGLRPMAQDVRRGIAALQRQRAKVSGELGVNPDDVFKAKVGAARTGAIGGGTVGMGVGIVATLGLLYLMRKTTPSVRRGSGSNPINIFS